MKGLSSSVLEEVLFLVVPYSSTSTVTPEIYHLLACLEEKVIVKAIKNLLIGSSSYMH